MNRSLKLSILMALALGSSQAAAVELGQAQVKSALGQPLLVEIPVTQATPAEWQSLGAQLAPNDAFVKVGGERPTIPLQFSGAPGRERAGGEVGKLFVLRCRISLPGRASPQLGGMRGESSRPAPARQRDREGGGPRRPLVASLLLDPQPGGAAVAQALDHAGIEAHRPTV